MRRDRNTIYSLIDKSIVSLPNTFTLSDLYSEVIKHRQISMKKLRFLMKKYSQQFWLENNNDTFKKTEKRRLYDKIFPLIFYFKKKSILLLVKSEKYLVFRIPIYSRRALRKYISALSSFSFKVLYDYLEKKDVNEISHFVVEEVK